jgi:FO synthase
VSERSASEIALDHSAVRALLEQPLDDLVREARALTLSAHGSIVTYSQKVFIPLTRLCRDVCHYCTFATTPAKVEDAYLSRDAVLEIARAGERAGCREALFTLGDRPEARYAAAREALTRMGHDSTLSYLGAMAKAVCDETSLLPHLNAGLMNGAAYASLRPWSASMGLMLESTAERLCQRGGAHFGSPDKHPAARLAAIGAAGVAGVPFTTGLLIGIGETRLERIDALLAIRDLHARYGHIQEVIIQNFRAKPGTRMSGHAEPPLEEHVWTVAVARLILGGEMTIQAPPNLHRRDELAALVGAGVNDWGGVSPVTPDHVNPEAPWPHLAVLADATRAAGRILRERLAIGPSFAREPERWCAPQIATRVRRAVDARGLPFEDTWRAGHGDLPPLAVRGERHAASKRIDAVLSQVSRGSSLADRDIVALLEADGEDVDAVVAAADAIRKTQVGDTVTYVVNRNINYTNICLYKCGFCAFSKGGTKDLRGPAYKLDFEEIGARAAEAWARGATEVCLQGGIHPSYDGNTYLNIVRAVRTAAPKIHIHAFSPLEITHGAYTLDRSLTAFLSDLREAGLNSLPGTAAEILDPEVRAIICPDKLDTQDWLAVMRAAHSVGLRSTATIMFGHVDRYEHWARHLRLVRQLQEETGGFTEFVPLPFVHMESPLWRKGKARSGPSWRECVLMHAVARLALSPAIPNIQVSWVKLGPEGAAEILKAGANDLGGVLMDESITRAAGGANGQCLDAAHMQALTAGIGRPSRQRTTFYGYAEPHSAVSA